MPNRKRTRGEYKTLKDWRSAIGLNQRDAAKILGISQAMYAQVELGHARPIAPKAKRIADKTGVSFESVMGVA